MRRDVTIRCPEALVRWTERHAVLMFVASAWVLVSGDRRLAGLAGAMSVLSFVVRAAGAWAPDGRFGLANAVTLARLALVTAVSFTAAPAGIVALGGLALLLDGVDGRVARAYGLSSEFGEYFDKETDALLLLSLCWCLVALADAPWWSLAIGLWRFGFVLILRIRPPARGYKETRSQWGPAVFVLSVGALLLALSPLDTPTALVLVVVTILVSASFVHALWSLYRA